MKATFVGDMTLSRLAILFHSKLDIISYNSKTFYSTDYCVSGIC